MSDKVLKEFEAAFGVWTTTGYFKHKPTQHQLDGFRKGYAIAEQASAERIAELEKALAAQNHIPDVGQMVQAQEPKSQPVANLNDLQIDEIARQVLDRVTHEWEGLQPWVYVFARKIESASRQLLGNPEQFKPPALVGVEDAK